MARSTNNRFPKLRPLDIRPFVHNGWPSVILRDPLQLSDNYVVIPQNLAPALTLCDGKTDLAAMQASLNIRYGLSVDADLLERLVAVLDESFLLDNERFAQATEQALIAYRQAPFRPPALAGQSYPDDPGELRRLLDGYLDAVVNRGLEPGLANGRGVASPHVDYARGGPVYAAVWKQAAEMARAAELVIMLGVDHYSPGDRLTLTRQNYATPYGVLPTARPLVDKLAEAIGPQAAFSGELRNRGEHSLELVAVWLHHVRQGEPCQVAPILTGFFSDFVAGQGQPAQDATLNAFLDALRRETAGRRVLVVASGDLSHVGPAFGGRPLNQAGRARIKAADNELMAHMAAGDPEGFFAAIKREQDRNNVCGVSPFYLMLRLLGDAEGQRVAYNQCPADDRNTSLVSICGMVFG